VRDGKSPNSSFKKGGRGAGKKKTQKERIKLTGEPTWTYIKRGVETKKDPCGGGKQGARDARKAKKKKVHSCATEKLRRKELR